MVQSSKQAVASRCRDVEGRGCGLGGGGRVNMKWETVWFWKEPDDFSKRVDTIHLFTFKGEMLKFSQKPRSSRLLCIYHLEDFNAGSLIGHLNSREP